MYNLCAQHSRSVLIDTIKGVAILLVVWGHFIQVNYVGSDSYFDNIIFKVIYSFHMPLFAIISGYLYCNSVEKRNIRALVFSRISGLLLPIVVWCGINWSISCVMHRSISLIELWNTITGNFLWFLWSMLAAQLLIGLTEKMVPIKYFLCGYIFGYLAMYLFPNPEYNLYLYPYVLLGFLWRKYNFDPYSRT